MNFQKRTWTQFEQLEDGQLDETLMRVGAQDLVGRFKSKHHLSQYFSEILGYYMPPIEGVNRDYLRWILKGKKRLLKMSDFKMTKVQKYEELSVRLIFKGIKDDGEILQLFPDMDEKYKPIDRQYFFNVVKTIQPEYLVHVDQTTQVKRNVASNGSLKGDYLLISDEWLSQLTSDPFISRKTTTTYFSIIILEKNGRTLQLMKHLAKIFKAIRHKLNPPPVTTLKKFRGLERAPSDNKQKADQLMIENGN